MKFTFGIITSQNDVLNSLALTINSIKDLNIPNYEIIIIGGNDNYQSDNLRVHSFEENPNGGWITKKKNLITKYARYENIVYLHDYLIFDKDWYKNFLNFGNDFKICMNRIINLDETRFRDWTLWAESAEEIGIPNPYYLIPYNIKNLSKLMYFSGSYWVAKKNVMEEFPLNEDLFWGQGEDVEWSKRIREKYNFSINENSIVRLLKYKNPAFFNCNNLEKIKKINETKQYNNI
jgi:hypothetical protein